MESEDWKPTEKVLEFEKMHGIPRNGEKQKMNDLTIDFKGWDNYLYWQTQDRKTLKK